MSYDLHVYAAAALSAAELRDLVARIPRLEVAEFDAARRWYSVVRGARRRYCFTVDGPFDVEAEDVPEVVTATLLGVTHVFYVTAEGSADADVPYAVRFTRTLAQALGGVVVDQQSDQIWARGVERTSAAPARNERVKVINLDWYTRRMFVGPEFGARYPAICRRLLPEALPRRFGEYEPLQGKLAEAGDDGFANVWRDATSILFFTASPPCISGSMWAGPAEQHPRPIWHMSVNLHYQPLAADPRWREAVRRFFLAIAEDLHAFFASAEVTRGNIWNGRSLWSDGETEWQRHPCVEQIAHRVHEDHPRCAPPVGLVEHLGMNRHSKSGSRGPRATVLLVLGGTHRLQSSSQGEGIAVIASCRNAVAPGYRIPCDLSPLDP